MKENALFVGDMRHNHNRKLAVAVQAGQISSSSVGGAGALFLSIRHDDWCALLRHGGYCNCDPELWLLGQRVDVQEGEK